MDGLWMSSAQGKLSDADQQMLTDILYKALYDALSERFSMVEHPGPQTIELRAALTQAKGANVPLNTITTVVPQLHLITKLGGLAADTAVLVGSASIEVEANDGITDRCSSPPSTHVPGRRIRPRCSRSGRTSRQRPSSGASAWPSFSSARAYNRGCDAMRAWHRPASPLAVATSRSSA